MRSKLSKTMSLTKRVEDNLRQRMKSGALKPGERLPVEKDMADELGVSRTVVREAVAALRSDGLLVSRHGVGVFVADSVADMGHFSIPVLGETLDGLEMEMAVKIHAAALAATRRSWSQAAKIYQCFEEMKSAIDNEELIEVVDIKFYASIAQATNNPLFSEFISQPRSTAAVRAILAGKDIPKVAMRAHFEKSLCERRLICNCIGRGDVEGSRAAMETHLRKSHSRYMQLVFFGGADVLSHAEGNAAD